MPFSFTETKENAMNYIHDRPLLSGLFFNPFVVCIIMLIVIMIIHYIFDREYEESECESHIIMIRHAIVTYISLICVIIIHDILIKDRYRARIKDLEEQVKVKETNVEESNINTIYQTLQ